MRKLKLDSLFLHINHSVNEQEMPVVDPQEAFLIVCRHRQISGVISR